MNAELEVIQIIQEEFNKAKLKNSSYSLRAFAKRLNLSPATLSGIFTQKLRVTRKAAEKIFLSIPVPPEKKERILSQMSNKKAAVVKGLNDQDYTVVGAAEYRIFSEWYYFGLLSLAETDDFRDDPQWIAKRLNIQLRQARQALKTLEELNLIARNEKGHLAWTGKSIRTTNHVNPIIRKAHFDNLDLARRSLEQDDPDERDITTIMMAIDPAKLPEARERIKKFRRELCSFLEADAKKEVYRLVIQLFPLSGRE